MSYKIRNWSLIVCLLTAALLAQEKSTQEDQDFRFASQLADKEMYDLAALQFQKYVDHYPDSPQAPAALFRSAECLSAKGDASEAARVYLQLLLQFPQSALGDKALFNRAKILAAAGDHTNAALTFERIRVFAANSDLIPQAMLSAAEEYLAAKDLQKSLESAYYITEKYPAHPLRFDARYLAAWIHQLKGQTSSALFELDKTSGEQLAPALHAKVQLLRAQIMQNLGRYNVADSLYASVLREPVAVDSVGAAAVQYVQSLIGRGLLDRALETLQNALNLKIAPEYRDQLLISQADLFYLRNEFAQALQPLEGVQQDRLSPWQRMCYSFRRAMILSKQRQEEAALPFFLDICQHADSSRAGELLQKRALIAASDILASLQRPGESLRLLRQMYDAAPYLRDVILLQKGRIQQDIMHDWPGARLSFDMLLDFYPDSPLADDAWLGVARAYDQEGDFLDALKAYQQYQKLFIGADDYAYAADRIAHLRDFAPLTQTDYPAALQSVVGAILESQGRSDALMALAREQIQMLRNFTQGQAYLRRVLSIGGQDVDVIEPLYWMGFCHARLARAAELQKDVEAQKAQTDSLIQILRAMADKAPADPRTVQLQYESALASLKLIPSAYEQAVWLNNLLGQAQMPDSLLQPLQYRSASCWFKVAGDSANSKPLFQRAASMCQSILKAPVDETIAANTLLLQYKLYNSLQRPDSAEVALRTLIDRYSNAPAVAEAMWTLAGDLEKQLRYADAAEFYRDLAQRFYYTRQGEKAQERYCQVLFRLGDDDSARACVDACIHLPYLRELRYYLPDDLDDETLWLSAQLEMRRGDAQAVLTSLKDYLLLSDQGRHRAEALMAMAEQYNQMRNIEAALGQYQALITTFPQDTLAQIARLRSAELYFDRGDYKAALDAYQTIKGSSIGDTQRQAAAREVVCQFRLGNTARARTLVDAFKKTYKDRPSEAVFLYEDASFCLANKDFKTAEDLFKELASRYRDLPAGADGDLGLARLYVILNRNEEALKILTNIPGKYTDPRVLAVAYVNLGEFYYENRQLDNCLAAGRKALEYDKTSPERQRALVLLIRVFDDLRLWDNAITLLREYVAQYPDAEDRFSRRVQIGVFLINLREYDRGIAELRDLLPGADAENEAEIQYWIAHAYSERGNLEEAITEYLKVKYVCRPTKLPWGTTALYEAGQAYVKLGQLPQARSLFAQIVKEMGLGDQFGKVANERIKEIDAQLAPGAKKTNG